MEKFKSGESKEPASSTEKMRKYQVLQTEWSSDFSTLNSLADLAGKLGISSIIRDGGDGLIEGLHKGQMGDMRIKFGEGDNHWKNIVTLYLPNTTIHTDLDRFLTEQPDDTLVGKGDWFEFEEDNSTETK